MVIKIHSQASTTPKIRTRRTKMSNVNKSAFTLVGCIYCLDHQPVSSRQDGRCSRAYIAGRVCMS